MLDHRMIGRAVVATRAGRSLRRSAPPSSIAAACTDLLDDERYRTAAAIRARFRVHDGARGGADALEELLTTRTSPDQPAFNV